MTAPTVDVDRWQRAVRRLRAAAALLTGAAAVVDALRLVLRGDA